MLNIPEIKEIYLIRGIYEENSLIVFIKIIIRKLD